MRVLKILGLAAVVATALMALGGAGSASATTLTCTNANGEVVRCNVGTEIDASIEGSLTLTGGLTISCTEGTVESQIENAGNSTETVSGATSKVTFNLPSCNNCSTITVTNGTLELHTDKEGVQNGNGTLTGSGFTAHLVCFGVTCNYASGGNNGLGTLTGSSTTGGTAILDINTTLLREKEGSSFLCGGNAAWEGSYKVTSPDWLDVD
jgi:hypothetical protein